jgi:hypothetical protein
LTKSQTWLAAKPASGHFLDVVKGSATRGRQFLLQQGLRLIRRIRQTGVEPGDIACNFLVLTDLLDSVDRSCVAVISASRPLNPMQTFDLDKAVVSRLAADVEERP